MKVTGNLHWRNIQHRNGGEENIFKPREATYIAKISGGWLLKSTHFWGRSSSMTTQAMTFVPDSAHEWEYDREPQGWQRVSQKSSVNYGDVTDKLEVWHGCVYRNSFFNANKEMHVSLVYVAENVRGVTEEIDNICIPAMMSEEGR